MNVDYCANDGRISNASAAILVRDLGSWLRLIYCNCATGIEGSLPDSDYPCHVSLSHNVDGRIFVRRSLVEGDGSSWLFVNDLQSGAIRFM